jgi:hypothetical protein
MPSDPLQTMFTALQPIVSPNPALVPPPANLDPSQWTPGAATTNATFYPAVQGLLGILFQSSELSSVGTSINQALTQIATLLSNFATQLYSVASQGDVASTVSGIQQALQLAATLAPSAAAPAVNAATGLFTQLQSILAVTTDVKQVAAELAGTAQILNTLAGLF